MEKSEHSEKAVEEMVLAFLAKLTEKGKCPLAGNSVHTDRAFIAKYMPKLRAHFHHRNIDVSCIKELARRWYPKNALSGKPKKTLTHRALDDIRESIAELAFYRATIFRNHDELDQDT